MTALESSHVVAGDISLTYFSSSDEGATSTILTAMNPCVQSYQKLKKSFPRGILHHLECDTLMCISERIHLLAQPTRLVLSPRPMIASAFVAAALAALALAPRPNQDQQW